MKTYKHNGWDVPEGFQIVHKGVTDEMQRVGGHVNSEWLNDNAPIGESRYAMTMIGVYQAMLSAAPQPPAKPEVSAEPVEYQSRMRAMWMDEGEGWTDWERCTEAVYRNLLENPTHHNQWQYEVRALYLAQPDAQAIRDAALDEAAKKCEALADTLQALSGGSVMVANREEAIRVAVDYIRALKGGAA